MNGGQSGIDVYTPPTPEPSVPPTEGEEEGEQEERKDIQQPELKEVEESQEEDKDNVISLDEEEELKVQKKEEEDVGLVKRLRPIRSRPTSGMEVFDHMTPDLPPSGKEERFPTRRTSVLSRAMSLLRQKSPPPDSIHSSVLGLCAAQATMLAAGIIGTGNTYKYFNNNYKRIIKK